MGEFIYEVIDQIQLLKSTIFLTIAMTAVFFVVCMIMTRNFEWNKKKRRLMGLFYNIKNRDSLLIAICMMKFNLVLGILIDGGNIFLVHLVFYAELTVIYIINRRHIKETLLGLFNGIVTVLMLFASDFLNSYLVNVVFNRRIAFVNTLIIIFLLVYSVYDLLWCVVGIVTTNRGE